LSHSTAFSQAAILVARLSHNISIREERIEYAEKVIVEGNPLFFSVDAWRWFRSDKDTPETERKLTDAQENILSHTLAERIKVTAKEGPMYISYPEDSPSMLAIWANWISRDETNQYLAQSFSLAQQNILDFLKTYLSTAWGMESGLPHKSELRREQYDLIVRVVDAEIVLKHLRSIYGDDIDKATFETSGYDSSDKTTAFRFSSMHAHVKSEKETQSSEKTGTRHPNDSNGS
jgi:hypothetical protein